MVSWPRCLKGWTLLLCLLLLLSSTKTIKGNDDVDHYDEIMKWIEEDGVDGVESVESDAFYDFWRNLTSLPPSFGAPAPKSRLLTSSTTYKMTFIAYWASFHLHQNCAPPQSVMIEITCQDPTAEIRLVGQSSDAIQCSVVGGGGGGIGGGGGGQSPSSLPQPMLRCWNQQATTTTNTIHSTVRYECVASSSSSNNAANAANAVRISRLVLDTSAVATASSSNCPDPIHHPYYSSTLFMVYPLCFDTDSPLSVAIVHGFSRRCYCIHNYSHDGGPAKRCAGSCEDVSNTHTNHHLAAVTSKQADASCVTAEMSSSPPPPSINIPPGPYVTPDNANENVAIPHPPQPTIHQQTNCPHWSNGLLDWHDPATWPNNQLPSQDVTLPTNARVVIRTTVQQELGIITIPSSSELIVAEPTGGQDIALDFHGMYVFGRLTVGSETCRLQSTGRVVLTLHGTRPANAVTVVPPTTYKGIDVSGILSLHGKRYYRTWTRLAKTVHPGETILLLQDNVNWEPGQTIVLVTTAMKDSREWHRNEVLTVDSVHDAPNVGAAIVVTTPVRYQHDAIIGAYQAEVGLLSRNIVVQGAADDSEPTDPDPLNCRGSISFYGDYSIPCPDTELTGFGGHIMVHLNGKGYVQGVELHRMGQTNVLARYPMHFHLLGENCQDCYVTDSSIHRSYYRCVSIHGTNRTLVSENVAYDVSGFCYYLEDGVEEFNTISFNLAAHIHMILGSAHTPPTSSGNRTPLFRQSATLTLPADLAAAGFYITNIHNYVVGNAASGGWTGFAFPHLPAPIGPHRDINFRPMNVLGLVIDGNTAHSAAWWWPRSGTFYFGGSLYYDPANPALLVYNPGRDLSNKRETCLVNKCFERGDCGSHCKDHEEAWITLRNNKAYLSAGAGLNAWNGRLDILGFEVHNVGLSVEGLQDGFYIDNMLCVCRNGHKMEVPASAQVNKIRGYGFFWYDTTQEHIISNSVFRGCGVRSSEFDQYNSDPTRGCAFNDTNSGCRADSFTFGFRAHSDQHNPEVMQATRNITFDNCGRRFSLHQHRANYPTTVSGRLQNWFDADGTVTGFGEPSLIGSGLADTGLWWTVDDEVVYEPQGPLQFIRQSTGPERGLGHVKLYFDYNQHDRVPGEICDNGQGRPCPTIGYIRHLGLKFAGDPGLPITANADVAGVVGGFGWFLTLHEGAPKTLRFELVETLPDTPLMFSLAYPLGTTVNAISAHALSCTDNSRYSCSEIFHRVDTVAEVRNSFGNAYHFDDNTGMLTVRIIMTSRYFVGNPDWILPTFNDTGRYGVGYALARFERAGILLPKLDRRTFVEIMVNCPTSATNPAYCAGTPLDFRNFDVCPNGYEQVAYDKCCSGSNPTTCIYANGNTSL